MTEVPYESQGKDLVLDTNYFLSEGAARNLSGLISGKLRSNDAKFEVDDVNLALGAAYDSIGVKIYEENQKPKFHDTQLCFECFSDVDARNHWRGGVMWLINATLSIRDRNDFERIVGYCNASTTVQNGKTRRCEIL